MYKSKTIILLFLSILPTLLFAEIDIRSHLFTTADGMANNSVKTIFQDSRGFIWLGTLNGLSRYDGNTFISFMPKRDDHITLSDPKIQDIDEDKNGLLWISLRSELYSCYDLKSEKFVDFTGCNEYKQSYNHKIEISNGDIWLWHKGNGCRRIVYKNNTFTSYVFKKQKHNLQDNNVKYIYEDNRKNIWIGCSSGVFKYEGNRLLQVVKNHDSYKMISYGNNCFFISTDGNIFEYSKDGRCRKVASLRAGTISGLFQYKDKVILFTKSGGFAFDLKDKSLRVDGKLNIPLGEVIKDNKGNCWIYNHTGLVTYVNVTTGKIKSLQLIPKDKTSFIDQERFNIVQDSRNIIWISTYGNGLFAYDLNSDMLHHFTSKADGSSHISNNYLLSLMVDKTNGIWVGSEYSGLSHLLVLNQGARRIFLEDERLSDRSNTVRMIARLDDKIYVGNRNGGVYKYNNKLDKLIKKESFNSNVYGVCRDQEGNEWIGTRGMGLYIGNKLYRNDPKDKKSLSQDNVFSLFRDSKGRMWIGTFGGGLNLAEKHADGYTFKSFFMNSYGQRQIRSLFEDKNGQLWVGTSEGLFIFNPDKLLRNNTDYLQYSYENGRLRNDEIKDIYQDSKGRIWIASGGAGVFVCSDISNYNDLKFKCYDTTDGLANNVAQSILEDKNGNIWIGTEYGISCFNNKKGSFENYLFSSSSLGNVYAENSKLLVGDELIFGTNNGLVIINPDKVATNIYNYPNVLFTNLFIEGNIVRTTDEDSPLDKSMSYMKKLNLEYNQNTITIEFSCFEYSIDGDTKYSYMLENYDNEWSKPSNLNFAAFKNLPSGKYILHVKACNSLGVWSKDEAQIVIIVHPPFWRTPLAILIYIIIVGVLLFFIFKIMKNFNSLRNKISVEKQLTEYKLIFFTNISHEFRTPLTLIQGALEKIQMSDNLPKELSYPIKVMDKSTKRMSRLINQLLEFRKMQNNKLSLHLEECDIISFLNDIYNDFKESADLKKIKIGIKTQVNSYLMYIDKGNVEKVVYNLLSNAVKYTPSGEKIEISVSIDEANKKIEIKVADTGIGIPKDKQDELFNRFMQINFSKNSMGIGLHLTKELVSIHHGTISYKENIEEGKGSIFTVTLPTDKSIYGEKDFQKNNTLILIDKTESDKSKIENFDIKFDPLNKRKVLIIEDDDDVRDFLKEEIGQYFEVETENNGKSGYEYAINNDIDLIVCDVMMPGMSGYEVTRKLKSDFSTSHIPIILLTALTSSDNHIQGIECGADSYITKPFSFKMLMTSIFKLIEQRDRLREKFSKTPGIMTTIICSSNKEKDFSDKLESIIDREIGNADYSVDNFAQDMNMGRTAFYRKIRGVTGYSPNEYIRVVRMKKAAELLLEGKYTVSEVSYKVGINDPFYFSKCFKQQFGVAPSQYNKG